MVGILAFGVVISVCFNLRSADHSDCSVGCIDSLDSVTSQESSHSAMAEAYCLVLTDDKEVLMSLDGGNELVLAHFCRKVGSVLSA